MAILGIDGKPLAFVKQGQGGKEYTGANGVTVDNTDNVISCDGTIARVYEVQAEATERAVGDLDILDKVSLKQDKLTAGEGVTISSDNVISSVQYPQQSFALTMTPSVTDIITPPQVSGGNNYNWLATMLLISGRMQLTKNESKMKIRITQSATSPSDIDLGLGLYELDESETGLNNKHLKKIAQTAPFRAEMSMPIVAINQLLDDDYNEVNSLILDTNKYYYAVLFYKSTVASGFKVRGHNVGDEAQFWPFINAVGQADITSSLPSDIYANGYRPQSVYVLTRS